MAAKRRYNTRPAAGEGKSPGKIGAGSSHQCSKGPNSQRSRMPLRGRNHSEQTCKTRTFPISCVLSLFRCNIKGLGSWGPSGSLGEILLSWCWRTLSWLGRIVCFTCMHAQPVRTYMNVCKSFGNNLVTSLEPDYGWLLSSGKRLRSSRLTSETIGDAEREDCSYLWDLWEIGPLETFWDRRTCFCPHLWYLLFLLLGPQRPLLPLASLWFLPKQAYTLCPLDPPLLLLLKDLFSLSWQPYLCRKLGALMVAGNLSVGISKMSELGHLWLGPTPRVLALPFSVAVLTPTWQTQVLLIHLPITGLFTHHCLLLPFLEGESDKKPPKELTVSMPLYVINTRQCEAPPHS